MRKTGIRLFFVLSIVLALMAMAGCSKHIATSSTTFASTTSSPKSPTQPIPNISQPLSTPVFGSFGANTSPKEIILNGSVKLPEGTILRAALYVSNPDKLWPIQQDISVHNGTWAITIKPGQNGAPDVLPSHISGFTVLLWQKDDLSVFMKYPILILAPPDSSW